MRTLRLGLITIILLSLSVGCLFAGGFALSGIGSKAIGMGGAFRGMADDGSAMYWNPAGLGFMDHSFITLAGAGIMPNAEFTNGDPDLSGFTTDKVTAEKKLWLFPNLYAVRACECRFKFGVGAYVPYGLGAEWDAYDLPVSSFWAHHSPVDSELVVLDWADGFPEKEMKSSIGIVDIHPTVAYQLSDHVAIGAGLSVNYGMIEIKKLIPNYTFSSTIMDLDGTGLGFGANMGIMYKINDQVQVGISGKIPSSIKLDGDAEIKTWVSNKSVYYSHLMHPNGTDPADSLYAYAIDEKSDAKATVNLPGDLGWGISLKPNPRWTINADVSYTFWNALDRIIVKLDKPYAQLGNLDEKTMWTNWKDTYRVSLGTEYAFSKVDLRGGFFYDQSPLPYSSLNPNWPDTADKYSANGGLGFHLGKWLIDLNYEHIFFAERNIVTHSPDNMLGTYNTGIDAANLGITYNF
jgi:long-chain fatty acid transport protein